MEACSSLLSVSTLSQAVCFVLDCSGLLLGGGVGGQNKGAVPVKRSFQIGKTRGRSTPDRFRNMQHVRCNLCSYKMLGISDLAGYSLPECERSSEKVKNTASQEAKKPRYHKVKKPENQEANKPTSQETQKPSNKI